jgi:hypothetical protein
MSDAMLICLTTLSSPAMQRQSCYSLQAIDETHKECNLGIVHECPLMRDEI